MNNNNQQSQRKAKNEIEEINEIFEKFQKHVENYDDKKIIDYEEVYRKNEQISHFNKRIIECNKICIKFPEINQVLYEEQKCLDSCQRKILEVEGIVKKYMNELKVGKFDSPYINPNPEI